MRESKGLVCDVALHKNRGFPSYIAYSGVFFVLAVCEQLAVGAYGSDHGQASDESAYFVTSLMICDYVRNHLFSNPLTFAKNYYAHFPRVALGHYPPLFPAVQAFMLIVFGRGGWIVTTFQAFIAGVVAAIPAALVGRSLGIFAGFLAGASVFFSPLVLFGVNTDMADNFMALFVVLAAVSWGYFYQTRTWRSAIAFSACASASILTKGTGFGLALVPIAYVILKRDLRFLLSPKALLSGLLVAVAVVPWYLLTYKLAAAGFVYSWGPAYTSVAAPFFTNAVLHSIGIPLAGFYIAGLYFIISDALGKAGVTPLPEPGFRPAPPRKPGVELDPLAFGVTSLSQFVFPMIVPADLAARYIIPVIPCAIIVSFFGLFRLVRAIPHFARHNVSLATLCGALVALSLVSVYRAPHVEPFHSDILASYVIHSGQRNPLVLVSGAVGVEGAVISSFAELDPDGRYYVVRGSQVLSTGNFMGTKYELKFTSPAAMADWIRKNQIGWIIVADGRDPGDMPHSRILKQALRFGYLKATFVRSIGNSRASGGKLSLYALPAAHVVPGSSDPVFSLLKPAVAL